MVPTHADRTDCFSEQHYINPCNQAVPGNCHSFHASMMTGTHQEELFDRIRVLWFFIELNMLFFFIITRHRRQQNPAPAQPEPPPHPQPQPRRSRRKPQNPWVMPWLLQREERGCYRTLLDELITTDIPGYRNFTRI